MRNPAFITDYISDWSPVVVSDWIQNSQKFDDAVAYQVCKHKFDGQYLLEADA